jgi:kinesin family protein 15
MGCRYRTTAATQMNRSSSRSHSILTLVIQAKSRIEGAIQVKEARVHLVDLAGSERQKWTSSSGQRLKEGGHSR